LTYFLDTNICIHFLKGDFPILLSNFKRHKASIIKISAIVAAELRFGAEKSIKKTENHAKIKEFLKPFSIVPFDDKSASVYAEIRTACEKIDKPVGPNDLLIAATVMAANGTLVTRNRSEFSSIKGLNITDWT